jgi:hypothetical protein
MAESLISNDMGHGSAPNRGYLSCLDSPTGKTSGEFLTHSTAAQPALVPHGALSEPRASCAAELHSSLQAILQS